MFFDLTLIIQNKRSQFSDCKVFCKHDKFYQKLNSSEKIKIVPVRNRNLVKLFTAQKSSDARPEEQTIIVKKLMPHFA